MRRGIRRWLSIRTRTAVEIDEELDSLIASRVEYLIARGVSPDAARAEALGRLGASLDDARRQLHHAAERRERRMRFRDWMEDCAMDVRYAARGLMRRPGFTAVVLLTLAIGIGATTAIFSAVNVLVLRALPFPKPAELMKLTLVTPPHDGRAGSDEQSWSYPKFVSFRGVQHAFAELAVYTRPQFTVTSGDVENIQSELVGATYLRTLGVPVARGRDFDRALDDGPGAARQAILSHAFWQRRFAGDPAVVGTTISLGGDPYVIVGITPPGFAGLTGQAEIFVPVTTREAANLSQAQLHEFSVVARRRPGVTVEQAIAETRIIGKQAIGEKFPDRIYGATWGAKAWRLDDVRVAPLIRRSLLTLLGAVAFVLLIACVNVANLLLGRAATRQREMAVRLAIGAGRGRLVRLLLTESVLVAVAGGIASLAVAWIGVRALSATDPVATLRMQRPSGLGMVSFSGIALDWRALAFALGLALVVGIAFGLAPALQSARAPVHDALKRSSGSFARGGAGRRALVVLEVALALVLLSGSGLMIRSLANVLAVDTGFDGRGVLTFRVSVPPHDPSRDSLSTLYMRLVERLGALPGVTDASLGNCPPLTGGCMSTSFERLDLPKVPPGQEPIAGVHWVTPTWFSTLRVPLRRGRLFDAQDRAGSPRVMLVNETTARQIWPNEDPIGKRVAIGMGAYDSGAVIVGIVGDVRQAMEGPQSMDAYIPYAQAPMPALIAFLRTSRDPASLGVEARRAVHDISSQLPVYDMQTLTVRSAGATAQARFGAALFSLFGFTALSLAAIGVYGVISLGVSARTREIGIRIALGADGRRVRRLVIGEGLSLVSAGAAIGLVGAIWCTRLLRTLLFDLTPADPVTYAGVIALLAGAALVASWLPARRAAQVDPVQALRSE